MVRKAKVPKKWRCADPDQSQSALHHEPPQESEGGRDSDRPDSSISEALIHVNQKGATSLEKDYHVQTKFLESLQLTPVASPIIAETEEKVRDAGQEEKQLPRTEAAKQIEGRKEQLKEAIKGQGEVIGRENQLRKISLFLACPLKPILYICGPPGSGKTLCINHTASRYTSFQFLFLNGMNFAGTDLAQVETHTEKRVVVLDEFEFFEEGMVSKIRELLKPVKIILICNDGLKNAQLRKHTHEITELYFMPYTSQQISRIATRKLDHITDGLVPRQAFSVAVSVAARKSGDVREFEKYLLSWANEGLEEASKGSQVIKAVEKSKDISCYLHRLIINNTIMVNRLLVSLINKQASITGDKQRKKLCICKNLNIHSLRDEWRNGGLSQEECICQVLEWEQMGLLRVKRERCGIHHLQHYSIALAFDLDKATELLNKYCYGPPTR